MKEINGSEFKSVTASGLVLIDFTAEWCGPCKAMLPTLQRISTAYTGKLAVYSVDTDKAPEVASSQGVMSMPTLMLFKDGRMVERLVGAQSEGNLRKAIDPHV
jgi:thioredoxin 1